MNERQAFGDVLQDVVALMTEGPVDPVRFAGLTARAGVSRADVSVGSDGAVSQVILEPTLPLTVRMLSDDRWPPRRRDTDGPATATWNVLGPVGPRDCRVTAYALDPGGIDDPVELVVVQAD